MEPSTIVVPVGTVGLDIDSKKKIAPKYRFNTTVTVPLVGSHVIGCDEFARERDIVFVEGRRLSIAKEVKCK